MSLRMDAFSVRAVSEPHMQVPTLTLHCGHHEHTPTTARGVFVLLITRQHYLDRGIIGMEFAVSS